MADRATKAGWKKVRRTPRSKKRAGRAAPAKALAKALAAWRKRADRRLERLEKHAQATDKRLALGASRFRAVDAKDHQLRDHISVFLMPYFRRIKRSEQMLEAVALKLHIEIPPEIPEETKTLAEKLGLHL